MWAKGWRNRRLSVGAAALAASLVAVGALTVWAPDPAAADTVVAVAQDAQIVSPGGEVHPARPGDTVPHGATVRTTRTGQAMLLTARRETWIGAASALRVDDGVRQGLTAGSVMVDARRAAGLTLATDAAAVTLARGALVRVERGPMLRVAQFAGASSVVPNGRRASTAVAALHQVQVARGGLPGPVTALALTSDRWERAMVGDLVGEDADLTNLAAGLDGPGAAGQAVLAVLPVGLQSLSPAAVGAPRSEQALAWGIAAAGPTAESTTLTGRYAQVRRFRSEGGSWAVVARLVGADVAGIDGLLERLLEPAGAPLSRLDGRGALAGPGLVPGSMLPGSMLPGSTLPGSMLLPGSSPEGSAAPQPGAGNGTGPTGTAPSPGTSSAPSPRPTANAPDAAQGVVDTVVALLPTRPPSPRPLPGSLPGSLPTPLLSPPLAAVSVAAVSVAGP